MLKKWLYLKKTAAPLPEDADNNLFKQVFGFLISRISNPGNGRTADTALEISRPPGGRKKAIHTYLLFEKYLTSFRTGQRWLYKKFPTRLPYAKNSRPLYRNRLFSILFVSEIEQKNTLATEFIHPFR